MRWCINDVMINSLPRLIKITSTLINALLKQIIVHYALKIRLNLALNCSRKVHICSEFNNFSKIDLMTHVRFTRLYTLGKYIILDILYCFLMLLERLNKPITTLIKLFTCWCALIFTSETLSAQSIYVLFFINLFFFLLANYWYNWQKFIWGIHVAESFKL